VEKPNESSTEDEIEITPEMIEARRKVLMRFETEIGGSEAYWAELVYIAMKRAEMKRST
jgi:hypothetical protein